MRGLPRSRWIAGAAVLALALTACGGDDDSGDGGSGSDGEPTGSVSVNGCDPENPFVPANTNETCGGNPMDQIFTGLVSYNTEDASPENAIASDISSDDNVTWTITLEEGWTFHDGSPVTANSFVDAWNYAANGTNAQLNSYFFCDIEGATETDPLTCAGAAEGTAPSAETLSGLEVVSDTEFTVKLVSAQSAFPVKLGYLAYSPLPEVFFEDPEAFGEAPIGTGPFEFVSFEPNVAINLTAYDDFNGEKPNVKDVEYKIYSDLDAAYADLLADNLDILEDIPTSALADDTYKSDLGEGKYLNQPIGVIQTIALPTYVEQYNIPGLGVALSKAIDRQAVIDVAFPGRIPAQSLAAPVVNGYSEDACGEACEYDPEAAKAEFDALGFTGDLTLSYNADGDHKTWTEATCQSISEALGVGCTATPVVDFATHRQEVNDRAKTGLFRNGWQMDYPSIENFLVPIYQTGSGSNDNDYSNPDVDALLEEAATLDGEESIAKYQEAEQLILEDMTTIPLWYSNLAAGWSQNVESVEFSPFSIADLSTVEISS